MRTFAKYHGLGNAFILVDGTGPGAGWSDLAVRLCDPHRGVGADGLIVALPGSDGSELGMLLHNADGGRAETSGNGLRCLALYARDTGLVAADEFVIATDSGQRSVRVGRPSVSGVAMVRVDMGRATLGASVLDVSDPLGGGLWRGRGVDVGNPHVVLVEEDLEALEVSRLGPILQAGRPGGVNVEWIRARPGVDELDLRVWERGVGMTLACGTGSVAAARAGIAMGLVRGPTVLVHNPGGTLEVECSRETAWLSGPAQRIAWLDVNQALLGEAAGGEEAARTAAEAGAEAEAGAAAE
ncbi:MAG: diaminopimelate epimerase, partial [Acidimicrobiales bacterium]